MNASIKTIPFGDKGAIARMLQTSGRELKASVLESAVLPILSNALAGFTTFSPLIKGSGHNAKCPLQSALWSLMHTNTGKPRTTATARALGAVFGLVGVKSADQESHDETIDDAIILIADALTPVQVDKIKTPRVDYEALYAGALITIAELQAQLTEATARATAPEPITV